MVDVPSLEALLIGFGTGFIAGQLAQYTLLDPYDQIDLMYAIPPIIFGASTYPFARKLGVQSAGKASTTAAAGFMLGQFVYGFYKYL